MYVRRKFPHPRRSGPSAEQYSQAPPQHKRQLPRWTPEEMMTSTRITRGGTGMSTPTPSPAGFPRALLEQPVAARLRYFETKVVAHQQLKQVHADLLHAIRHPA